MMPVIITTPPITITGVAIVKNESLEDLPPGIFVIDISGTNEIHLGYTIAGDN